MKRACFAGAITAVLLTGCAASDDSLPGMPGPVPEGVTFQDAPDAAPPAPAFQLSLLGGENLDAAAAWAERPMMLVFFESWCEICREQQQAINDLAEEYEDIVLFLGVANLSSEQDVLQYVRDNNVPYPVGIDTGGEIWLDYAAAEPPLVALVTKGGHVARGWPGGIDGDRLREEIDEVLVKNTG